MFMVSGGVYTDMSFREVVSGTEEVYGPFETRDEAVIVWRGKMGNQIDTCEHRLFVVDGDPQCFLGEKCPLAKYHEGGIVAADQTIPVYLPRVESQTFGKLRRLDYVNIIGGSYAGEKGRIWEVYADRQYGVRLSTGPDAELRGTFVAHERHLEKDDKPPISVCDQCGAEYPSAPRGTIHKCGQCSGGYCSPKVVN